MAELFFKDPRDYIKFEHELRRARRPSYSMRAFARDLSISPSSLNDFLQSRVGMSEERIENLSTKLNWSFKRKEHFRDLILARFDRDPGVRQSAQMRAKARTKDGAYRYSLDAFKCISDWYHLAIIELCLLKDAVDSRVISRDLNISSSTASAAVKRLLRLELLKETAQGLKPDQSTNYFGDDGPSAAIKTFQSQILELAQKALEENESIHHDSQSFIYSVPSNQVEKLLADIRKSVLDTLNRYAHEPGGDCIQAVTIQSFPIWRSNEGATK